MDVSIADAKNRLPELIRAVEDGEKVVITRHGRPVAQIAPVTAAPSPEDGGPSTAEEARADYGSPPPATGCGWR